MGARAEGSWEALGASQGRCPVDQRTPRASVGRGERLSWRHTHGPFSYSGPVGKGLGRSRSVQDPPG